MAQRIFSVGKSAAVSIPKKLLEKLGLSVGDRVEVCADKQNRFLLIKPVAKADKELIDWTMSFIERYRSDLEALAKK